MRIVLDTIVLVSGVFWAPSRIVRAWRENRLMLVYSPETWTEYERVLAELSNKYSISAGSVLGLVARHGEVVVP